MLRYLIKKKSLQKEGGGSDGSDNKDFLFPIHICHILDKANGFLYQELVIYEWSFLRGNLMALWED